jgi:hypothetical protein
LGETGFYNWSQLGVDQTVVSNNFTASASLGPTVTGSFATSPNDGLVAVVCPPVSGSCSWTPSGTGFSANDSLLWAFDNSGGGSGTGSITLSFGSPVVGAGAWVEADTLGSYTARIEAFNGSTSLGFFTATSNSSGDPVFLGVLQSPAVFNITKIVFSLTSCAGCNGGAGDLGDFAIDSLLINDTPEPGTMFLLAAGLAGIAWKARKYSAKNRRN